MHQGRGRERVLGQGRSPRGNGGSGGVVIKGRTINTEGGLLRKADECAKGCQVLAASASGLPVLVRQLAAEGDGALLEHLGLLEGEEAVAGDDAAHGLAGVAQARGREGVEQAQKGPQVVQRPHGRVDLVLVQLLVKVAAAPADLKLGRLRLAVRGAAAVLGVHVRGVLHAHLAQHKRPPKGRNRWG